MYGKIFESMYDGTLVEDWRALITFQQMIVLCDADGVIDMTASAISRRTGIPIEHIQAGIEILESTDPNSRTPSDDGRRIILIDEHRTWGWYIVNHNIYKHLVDADTIREQNKIRKRRQRERQKELQKVTNGRDCHAPSRHTDTDTDTDTKDQKNIDFSTSEKAPTDNPDSKPKTKKPPPVPYDKIVDVYHEILPELPRVEKLTDKRKSQIKKLWREDMPLLEHWRNYFNHVRQSDFLMGKKPPSNGHRQFRADIEWLTKQTNATNVAECKYHGD